MDSETLKEKYAKDMRDKYAEKQQKIATLKLRMKKPGLKQLFGQNPIMDEEFGDLDKYFKLSRSR